MIICSDSHYGTKSEFDINDSIHQKQLQIINYCINNDQDFFVHMGDVFDVENPSSEMIAKVVQWIVILEENKINSFIMLGNHDGKRLIHSLSFIKEMNLKYVRVIDYPQIISFEGLNLIFLPHIIKQFVLLENREKIIKYSKDESKKKLLNKLKDTDYYIEKFCKKVIEEIDEDSINLVFCHLNADGAILGPEDMEFKIKKHNIPEIIRKCDKIKYIFNGHIHRSQVIQREGEVPIIIPGSVENRRMDERIGDKYFLEVDLDEI